MIPSYDIESSAKKAGKLCLSIRKTAPSKQKGTIFVLHMEYINFLNSVKGHMSTFDDFLQF